MVPNLRDSYFGPLFVLYSRIFTRPVALQILKNATCFSIGYAIGLWFFSRPVVVTYLRSLGNEGGTDTSIQVSDSSAQADVDQQ